MPAPPPDPRLTAVLRQLQEHIRWHKDDEPPKIHWEDRTPTYIEELTALGAYPNQAYEILSTLTVKNYFRGPSERHDKRGGMCWEFKCKMNGKLAYIKFVFTSSARGEAHLTIISFHKDRPPKSPTSKEATK